jgi:hypothetical protein
MGDSLRTFQQGGQTFVLGRHGQHYAVVIRNRTSDRLEVVLSVDGRDAVHGRRSNLSRDRGYVLAPNGMVRIEGFRTSMETVAAFRFTDPSDSFAGRMGETSSLGVLQVAVFRERAADAIAMDRMKRPMRAASPRSARRPMMDRETQNLGTQFGETHENRAVGVSFVRDGRGVSQFVTLRYDDEAGLEARGIEVRPMEIEQPMIRHRRMSPTRFTQPPPS